MHSPCKGSTAPLTHSARDVKWSRARQTKRVQRLPFCPSTVEITDLLNNPPAWKKRRGTTRLHGRREEAPRWVRPKGSLAKRPPWLVTNICIKSIRKRKYGEILHLIHSPDLPGSAIQGHPGCKGTVGPLCAHPCSDPSHVGKTLSLSHTRRDGYFHPLPALSQATHCSSAEKSHMSKCLSWHQLHAIDVNGSGQLYTSWWSPSSPSQQIFWCPTYKISTEKVDLVQQVLCDACDTGLRPLSQRKV